MKNFLIIISGIIGLFVLIALGKSAFGPPEPPSCSSDYKLCADNADMANHYRGWTSAEVACKMAAERQAKYGTPEWPSDYFSTYLKGYNYITGTATLIEKNANFQNGFGVMAHARIECGYDFRSQKVINIGIDDK